MNLNDPIGSADRWLESFHRAAAHTTAELDAAQT